MKLFEKVDLKNWTFEQRSDGDNWFISKVNDTKISSLKINKDEERKNLNFVFNFNEEDEMPIIKNLKKLFGGNFYSPKLMPHFGAILDLRLVTEGDFDILCKTLELDEEIITLFKKNLPLLHLSSELPLLQKELGELLEKLGNTKDDPETLIKEIMKLSEKIYDGGERGIFYQLGEALLDINEPEYAGWFLDKVRAYDPKYKDAKAILSNPQYLEKIKQHRILREGEKYDKLKNNNNATPQEIREGHKKLVRTYFENNPDEDANSKALLEFSGTPMLGAPKKNLFETALDLADSHYNLLQEVKKLKEENEALKKMAPVAPKNEETKSDPEEHKNKFKPF